MNWKNRLTNYNFWISIFSAVLLILQALKIEFDIAYVNEIFTAVLGLLVVIGIISDPTRITTKATDQKAGEYVNNTTKVEEKQKEKVVLTPSEQENEIDHGVNENSLQIVLEEISKKINEKLELFESFKSQNQENKLESREEIEIRQEEIINVASQGETVPAVAEINPYVDVIN